MWHDLTQSERIEAASQVHAVVFAQLGALAHSMIELGCGLERSCAFVRRMSIRNQLPSSQRAMLVAHLLKRNDVGLKESKEGLHKEILLASPKLSENISSPEATVKQKHFDTDVSSEGNSVEPGKKSSIANPNLIDGVDRETVDLSDPIENTKSAVTTERPIDSRNADSSEGQNKL